MVLSAGIEVMMLTQCTAGRCLTMFSMVLSASAERAISAFFMLGNVLHIDAETLFQVVMAKGQLRVHRRVGKDVNLFTLLDQGIEHFAEMLRKTGLVGMQEPTLRDKDHRIVFDFLCDKAVVRVATIGTAVALRQEEAKGNAAAIWTR